MPISKHNRAKGKHKGGRVQYTGNKFLLTSAEALVIQGQIGQLQQYVYMLYGSLQERLSKLEPQAAAPSAEDTAATVPA